MDENSNREFDHNGDYNMNQDTVPAEFAGAALNKGKAGTFSGFFIGVLVGLIFAVALLSVLRIIPATRQMLSDYVGNTESDSKAQTVLAYLEAYYLYTDDLENLDIEDAMAKGLTSALSDKYAVYYTAEEYEALKASYNGEFEGIGVVVQLNDAGQVEVNRVYDNSPAAEAGIRAGDIITEVDGVSDFENLDSLVTLVRGDEGTSVNLTLSRGGESIEVTAVRAHIEVETITYEMMEDGIGYIKITEFNTVTDEQFDNAIDALLDEGMEALVLDLRDNPGGDFATVVAMCDRILPEGVIITTKDKNGTESVEYSDEENKLEIPMAAIVNGDSASASEVFVGALQDYSIATVVGEQSFGKGIVQSIFSFSDGSGLKFTTAEYYTPSGRSIQGVGITPDIEVSLPEDAMDDGVLSEDEDTQLAAAIEAVNRKNK